MILESLDLFGQIINRNLGIFNNSRDLELLDTISDSDQFTSSPHETVHFNISDLLFQFFQVGFVIPGLNIEDNHRLSNDNLSRSFLLLLLFKSNSFNFFFSSLDISIIFFGEQIKIIILLL